MEVTKNYVQWWTSALAVLNLRVILPELVE
jgi:hypothetical protein